MKNETAQILQGLADKLGTTVEHLWAVLVGWAPIDSAITLGGFAIFGAVLAIALHLLVKHSNKLNDMDNYSNPGTILMVIWFAVAALWVFSLLISIHGIAAGFFNPEYWALKEILE